MKKKLLALLLALTVTCALAACGEKGSGAETTAGTDGNAGTVKTQQSTEGEVKTADEDPVIFVTRGYNNVENKADNEEIRQAIIEASGINFEYVIVPSENWDDLVNIKIAASEEFDMLNIINDNGDWSKYSKRNALVPMNDLIEQYGQNILKVMGDFDSPVWKSCKDASGNIYALPRQESWTKGGVPFIRADWLEALGMETPATITELEAYFEAVKNTDLNGNGENYEIPYIPYASSLLSTFRPYFLGFHGERYLADDGTVMPWYMDENAYQMLETFHRWYEKGWLYKEYLTITTEQIQDLVMADRIGCGAGWYNAPMAPTDTVRKSNPDSKMDWISLPNLTDFPEGGMPAWTTNPINVAAVVMSATNQNPETAVKLVDWMFASTENYMLCTYGIEGKHWEWTDDSHKTFRRLDTENYNIGFYQFVEWFDTDIFPKEEIDQDNYRNNAIEKMQQAINRMEVAETFDYYIPYDFTGTEAEMLNNDADTIIEEAAAKVVSGEFGQSEWENAVKTAWDTDGTVRSKVWTEQYKAFTTE